MAAAEALVAVFEDIVSVTTMLADQSSGFNHTVAQSGCNVTRTTFPVAAFHARTKSFNGMIDAVLVALRTSVDYLELALTYGMTIGLAVVQAMLWLLACLGLGVAVICARKCDACIYRCGICTMVGLLVLIGFQIMISVGIADFCYGNPDVSVVTSAEAAGVSGWSVNLVRFYASCEGVNPIQQSKISKCRCILCPYYSRTVLVLTSDLEHFRDYRSDE